MDVGVLNARVNLNTNPFYQFIGLGNAPQEGDPMYIDCTPFGPKYPDGWRSVDKDVDESWPTERGGLCLYFNGAKSPNFSVTGRKKPPFPKMMNEDMRKEIEMDAGGDETPMYYKQFYGFPPSIDISDKLLSVKLMMNHRAFMPVVWEGGTRTVLGGFDPGFRKDGDPCIAQFGVLGAGKPEVLGEENAGFRRILAMEKDGIPLVPKQGSTDSFETQIARAFVDECSRRGCHDVAMDVTGDGGIMLQHIEREAQARGYKLNVLAVSFSGLAEEKIVIPGEKREAREMFANMVAQLWGTFRLGRVQAPPLTRMHSPHPGVALRHPGNALLGQTAFRQARRTNGGHLRSAQKASCARDGWLAYQELRHHSLPMGERALHGRRLLRHGQA